MLFETPRYTPMIHSFAAPKKVDMFDELSAAIQSVLAGGTYFSRHVGDPTG